MAIPLLLPLLYFTSTLEDEDIGTDRLMNSTVSSTKAGLTIPIDKESWLPRSDSLELEVFLGFDEVDEDDKRGLSLLEVADPLP